MKIYYVWIALATLLGVMLATPIIDGDVFFALSLGRWLFHTGLIPATDPFLYTLKDWHVLHQWLSYPIFYIFHFVGGAFGLVFLRILIWFALFGIIIRKSIKWTVPQSLTLLILFVALIPCSYRFIDRASVFSDLILIWMTAELLQSPVLSRRMLFLFPLLFALWVNLHAGFVIGLALYSGYVVTRFRKASILLWVSLVTSYLACLLNPNFLEGALFPLYTAFKPEWALYRAINFEWMPTFEDPFLSTWEVRTLILLLLSCFTLILWAWFKNWRRITFALFAFCIYAYLAQSATRFMSTSALGFALLAVYSLSISGFQLGQQFERFLSRSLAAVFLGLALWAVANGYPSVTGHRNIAVGIDEKSFPVAAAKYIEENKLEGRIFNQYEWGSYLIWALDRRDNLFIHTHIDDPRLLVDGYYGTGKTSQEFEETVAKFNIRYFLLDKKIMSMQPAPALLSSLATWKILYQDETAVLWGLPN